MKLPHAIELSLLYDDFHPLLLLFIFQTRLISKIEHIPGIRAYCSAFFPPKIGWNKTTSRHSILDT